MMNPYEVLGVSEKATTEEIKKAYREKAKSLHPDNQETGNEAEFQKVNSAYLILVNPEKRKRYDETGEADENEGIEASEQMILALFNKLLEQDLPLSANYVDVLEETLKSSLSSVLNDGEENSRQIKKLKKLRKKFKRKGKGTNIFGKALDLDLRKLELKGSKIKAAEIGLEDALRKIKDYDFDPDVPTEEDVAEQMQRIWKGKLRYE